MPPLRRTHKQPAPPTSPVPPPPGAVALLPTVIRQLQAAYAEWHQIALALAQHQTATPSAKRAAAAKLTAFNHCTGDGVFLAARKIATLETYAAGQLAALVRMCEVAYEDIPSAVHDLWHGEGGADDDVGEGEERGDIEYGVYSDSEEESCRSSGSVSGSDGEEADSDASLGSADTWDDIEDDCDYAIADDESFRGSHDGDVVMRMVGHDRDDSDDSSGCTSGPAGKADASRSVGRNDEDSVSNKAISIDGSIDGNIDGSDDGSDEDDDAWTDIPSQSLTSRHPQRTRVAQKFVRDMDSEYDLLPPVADVFSVGFGQRLPLPMLDGKWYASRKVFTDMIMHEAEEQIVTLKHIADCKAWWEGVKFMVDAVAMEVERLRAVGDGVEILTGAGGGSRVSPNIDLLVSSVDALTMDSDASDGDEIMMLPAVHKRRPTTRRRTGKGVPGRMHFSPIVMNSDSDSDDEIVVLAAAGRSKLPTGSRAVANSKASPGRKPRPLIVIDSSDSD